MKGASIHYDCAIKSAVSPPSSPSFMSREAAAHVTLSSKLSAYIAFPPVLCACSQWIELYELETCFAQLALAAFSQVALSRRISSKLMFFGGYVLLKLFFHMYLLIFGSNNYILIRWYRKKRPTCPFCSQYKTIKVMFHRRFFIVVL